MSIKNTILITGGAGYVGSHTCLSLLENGYDLIIIDSFINSSRESLARVLSFLKPKYKAVSERINIIEGDIRDEKKLKNIFHYAIQRKKPIEAVIHFAGLKSVEESTINPLKYWDYNVNGALTLVRVMKENSCNKIIFSSSATIYGFSENAFLNEESEVAPENPYGSTKMAIEELLKNFYNSSPGNIRVINLRYFNPIGAHYSGIIGEDCKGEPRNIFPYLTKVASGKLDKLKVYGDDWPTKDGTGIRDYIHVMDLAEGHIRALEYILREKATFLNLNLGTGKGFSVFELIRTFEKTNNIKIPFVVVKRRKGDLAYVVADNKKAIKYLNWEPKRSLAEMCKDGWRWQSLNPNGFKNSRL